MNEDFNNKMMKIAINEAKKCKESDDVPVGCVISKDNKVISKAHNTKNKKNIVINHAEINAIIKANKKLGTWILNDCSIYITMEPCLMCYGAIVESRIKNVYYSIKNSKYSDINNNELTRVNRNVGLCSKESLNMVKKFFEDRRKH